MRKRSGHGTAVGVQGRQRMCTHGKGVDFHVELSGSSCQGLASLSGPRWALHPGTPWVPPGDFQVFSFFFYFLTWEQAVGEKEGHIAGVCVAVCVCVCVCLSERCLYQALDWLIAKTFSNLVTNFRWNLPSSYNPPAEGKYTDTHAKKQI